MMTSTEAPYPADTRLRTIRAARSLLDSGGRDALTTRALAAAAGIQAPTIYRLFGDMQGLMNAAAEDGYADFVARKAAIAPDPDPLADFRAGWDMHVAFGLENPALFTIMVQAGPSPATTTGIDLLRARVRRLAQAGMLKMDEEAAVMLTRAGGLGTVLALLETPEDERDISVSANAREAVIAAIAVTDVTSPSSTSTAAIVLRSNLDGITILSPGERQLLSELLARIARS